MREALALDDERSLAVFAAAAEQCTGEAVDDYLDGKSRPLVYVEAIVAAAAARLWGDEGSEWYPHKRPRRPRITPPLTAGECSLLERIVREPAVRGQDKVLALLLARLVDAEMAYPRQHRRRGQLLRWLRHISWRVENDPEEILARRSGS